MLSVIDTEATIDRSCQLPVHNSMYTNIRPSARRTATHTGDSLTAKDRSLKMRSHSASKIRIYREILDPYLSGPILLEGLGHRRPVGRELVNSTSQKYTMWPSVRVFTYDRAVDNLNLHKSF